MKNKSTHLAQPPVRALLLGVFLSFAGLRAACGQTQPLPYEPVGGRNMAMGASMVALARGSDALYQNPASLAWQKMDGSIGLQPLRLTRAPSSWWAYFFNGSTDFNMPASLILQGWSTPSQGGERLNAMIGVPVAYRLTSAIPAGMTVKAAFERSTSGKWRVGFPIDFGVMAGQPGGIMFGMVYRNVTLGSTTLETLDRRLEYGIALGGGTFTVTAASYLHRHDKLKVLRDRFRTGIEVVAGGKLALRGGYMHEPGDWWATGGIGLRSGGAPSYEFSYSLVYRDGDRHLTHYLQYNFVVY